MTIDVEMNRQAFSGELDGLVDLQTMISRKLHDALSLRTTVRLVEPGSLPRFEGKAKRVVDRRGDL
jgi:phenylacetate-CoA ligase (EC 6.2.1.30)